VLRPLRHPGAFQILRVAFTPDGAGLLSLEAQAADKGSLGSGALCRWDTATGRRLRRLPLGEPYPAGAAFSPDGRTLAVGGSYEGKAALRILDVPSGREGPVLDTQPDQVPTAFSPDGRLLAARDWGAPRLIGRQPAAATHLWEVTTGKEVLRLERAGL